MCCSWTIWSCILISSSILASIFCSCFLCSMFMAEFWFSPGADSPLIPAWFWNLNLPFLFLLNSSCFFSCLYNCFCICFAMSSSSYMSLQTGIAGWKSPVWLFFVWDLFQLLLESSLCDFWGTSSWAGSCSSIWIIGDSIFSFSYSIWICWGGSFLTDYSISLISIGATSFTVASTGNSYSSCTRTSWFASYLTSYSYPRMFNSSCSTSNNSIARSSSFSNSFSTTTSSHSNFWITTCSDAIWWAFCSFCRTYCLSLFSTLLILDWHTRHSSLSRYLAYLSSSS